MHTDIPETEEGQIAYLLELLATNKAIATLRGKTGNLSIEYLVSHDLDSGKLLDTPRSPAQVDSIISKVMPCIPIAARIYSKLIRDNRPYAAEQLHNVLYKPGYLIPGETSSDTVTLSLVMPCPEVTINLMDVLRQRNVDICITSAFLGGESMPKVDGESCEATINALHKFNPSIVRSSIMLCSDDRKDCGASSEMKAKSLSGGGRRIIGWDNASAHTILSGERLTAMFQDMCRHHDFFKLCDQKVEWISRRQKFELPYLGFSLIQHPGAFQGSYGPSIWQAYLVSDTPGNIMKMMGRESQDDTAIWRFDVPESALHDLDSIAFYPESMQAELLRTKPMFVSKDAKNDLSAVIGSYKKPFGQSDLKQDRKFASDPLAGSKYVLFRSPEDELSCAELRVAFNEVMAKAKIAAVKAD